MKSLLIRHQSDDPAFNLAAEDYFLHHFDEQVIFLYVNRPSVVIGKHQNAFKEVNWKYCKAHNIAVHRRLSGGGTVYHAPGNLNFCFITNGQQTDKLIDFRKQLEPVNQFLHSIGVPSEYSGRNDLLLHGLKISGNAEHVYSKKKRVIHHGTLLYNANLEELGHAIRPKPNVTYSGHAVESVRSKVTNVQLHLEQAKPFEPFMTDFQGFLASYFNTEDYFLTAQDLEAINSLADTKYSTWDWNWGYSPTFTMEYNQNGMELSIKVKKGTIQEAELNQFSEALVGTQYWPSALESHLPPKVIEDLF